MAIQDQINRITNEVNTQSNIISNIKTVLSDLDDGISAMGEEVKELAGSEEDLTIDIMTEVVAEANDEIGVQTDLIGQLKDALQGKAISGKQEQTKSIDIAENGTHHIGPDEGYTLSGVDVNVDVADDFIGIKYLNYSGLNYNLPKTADARALDKILEDPNEINGTVANAVNGHILGYAFYNASTNANGGYFVQLEEVYLPSKATGLNQTFMNCKSLKKLYGDFTNIRSLNVTFSSCWVLEDTPYMPNLTQIGNRSFYDCRALTKYVVPPKVTSIHTGAFQNTSNLLDIYVAFAEGAISGAPWGATNATIHYNTQYDTDGNPIIEEV